jgi:hypothetical protein
MPWSRTVAAQCQVRIVIIPEPLSVDDVLRLAGPL